MSMMPTPPDFDQLAKRIYTIRGNPAEIAEQLREIWNSRGDADRSLLDGELSSMMGATAAGPYVKNLDRALRSLDQ